MHVSTLEAIETFLYRLSEYLLSEYLLSEHLLSEYLLSEYLPVSTLNKARMMPSQAKTDVTETRLKAVILSHKAQVSSHKIHNGE